MVDYPSNQPAGKKVAVVVPVKNDAQRLAVMLASLSKQTVEHEVIIVDNGSSDDSPSVGIPYGAKVLDGPGLRVGAMRNLGVAQTQAELLAFCDSDHEVPEDWLESAIASLAKHPGKTMVGAPCLPPIKSTWVQSVWAIHRLRAMNHGAFETEWLGAGNMILYRRDFLVIGGFSENLVASEDVDLSFRVRNAGFRVICDPKIINYHDGDPQTLIDFFRKERWRGSSGWKAWATQGYLLSELPSLLWPFWVVLGLVGLLTWTIMQRNRLAWNSISLLVAIGLICWMLPAIIRSLRACLGRPNFWFYSMAMSVLFLVYGLARFASIIRWSKNRIA